MFSVSFRYDLTGTCSDSHCKAQHRSDYELSSSQLFLDLLSYCPILLGDKVKSETSQAELAKVTIPTAISLYIEWSCGELT